MVGKPDQRNGGHVPGDKPVLRIECEGLSAPGQLAWVILCAGLREIAGSTHVIEVSGDGLSPECRQVLASGMLEQWFPGEFLVSASPRAPDSAADFVVVSGSEVFTSQLLARFNRVFVNPSTAPDGVDTALYIQERAEGRCFAALSNVVADGFLSGADPDLHAILRRFSPAARKVTLLTSVYRGDEYLDGFLENAAGLHDYAEHEHFLVRAASPGNEHEKLLAHVLAQPSAVYVNLAEDPGLYDVWNLVICLASGKYLSSSNLDDRRSPEHLETLARVLESNPEVDVASTALRVARVPNTPWETSGRCKTWYTTDQHPKGEYAWQELFRTTLEGKTASRNMPHCMPAWRRTMHASHGFFREREWGPSADWEFWLRAGTRGARLYLHPEALGLYLKRDDSYWNVSGVGEDFDAKIIRRYHPQSRAHETSWLADEAAAGMAEVSKLTQWNARFVHFHRLVQLACMVPDADSRKRIDAGAHDRFGIDGFCANVASTVRSGDSVSAQTAFDFAVWLLAERDPGTVDESRLRNWRLALADYGAMSGRLDEAMLATARLYWLRDERDAAWRLMQDAWRQRTGRFWPVFQSLFRFAIPLTEATGKLANDMHVPPVVEHAQAINLWYYPDFRNNNYQASLYEPLKAAGATVQAIDRNAGVDIEPADPAATNILHIHWIHTIFSRHPGEKPADAAKAFLSEIERAKGRGVRVLWSVHNYLNHQGRHRAVELQLRRDLARLVDDVYLHHPMIRDALDWLPKTVAPRLMEHGPYALAEDWAEQRRRARARLGLPENAKVVACAGQLRPYKQLEVHLPELLDWVARTPGAWLLVLGKIDSTEVREILSAANTERLMVIDRFLPESELDEYLCAADFGFLSYAAILTSGTLFHMLSRALPVIAPRKGTIPAYVVNGWNGYLYDDAETAGSALDAFDRLDADAFRRMHDNALSVARGLRWAFRVGERRGQPVNDVGEACHDVTDQALQCELEQQARAERLEAENAALAHDRDALLRYAAELEARYRRVLRSRTWKLMAPARVLARCLRAFLTAQKPARNALPPRPKLRSKP